MKDSTIVSLTNLHGVVVQGHGKRGKRKAHVWHRSAELLESLGTTAVPNHQPDYIRCGQNLNGIVGLHLKSNFKMNLNKSKSVFPPEAKTF